jgi:hypothetical protein
LNRSLIWTIDVWCDIYLCHHIKMFIFKCETLLNCVIMKTIHFQYDLSLIVHTKYPNLKCLQKLSKMLLKAIEFLCNHQTNDQWLTFICKWASFLKRVLLRTVCGECYHWWYHKLYILTLQWEEHLNKRLMWFI